MKMPFSRSVIWILVSVLLISGSAFMGWLYFISVRERRLHDEQYRIAAIVQNAGQKEPLKTAYLAELLNLSLDKPVNIYRFDVKAAEARLMASPVIKKAEVRKILPGTLYVQYEIRTPLMLLGNYTNTVIDNNGYRFPLRPFFTPKRLSTLYIKPSRDEQTIWGSTIQDDESLAMAIRIQNLFKKYGREDLFIKQIDLSHLKSDSYGQRQIVLILQKLIYDPLDLENEKKIYVRLSPDHYRQGLINFFNLYEKLLRNELTMHNDRFVIDFRVPHLAFIKKIE